MLPQHNSNYNSNSAGKKTEAHQEKRPTKESLRTQWKIDSLSGNTGHSPWRALILWWGCGIQHENFLRWELTLHGRSCDLHHFLLILCAWRHMLLRRRPSWSCWNEITQLLLSSTQNKRREQPQAVVMFLPTPPGGQVRQWVLGKFTTPTVNIT